MDERQIGQNIRALRLERGWSLTDAARRAGLSKATLSKIETARVSSPISTLLTVAAALEVPLSSFFVEGQESPSRIITRSGRAPLISRGGSQYGYAYRALALGLPNKGAEPFLLTVRPGDNPAVFRHGGQEFIYMLAGRLRLRLGGEEIVLRTGDSIYFDPRQDHSVEALDRRVARFLCVFIGEEMKGNRDDGY